MDQVKTFKTIVMKAYQVMRIDSLSHQIGNGASVTITVLVY